MIKIGESIPYKKYHESENMSSSKLIIFLRSPQEFFKVYVSKEEIKKYTDAMLIGNLFHTLVLEKERHKRDYITLGAEKTLKSDLVEMIEILGGEVEKTMNNKGEMAAKDTIPKLKEQLDSLREKEERIIVTQKQTDLAFKTAEKALKSEYVLELNGKEILKSKLFELLKLETAAVERVFYGEIEGVKFQVRPDLLMNLGKERPIWFCVDLKTAEDATTETFSKQCARFYYDVQQWIYVEILRQNEIDISDFRFCVAGKSDVSDCAYYWIDKGDIEDAGAIVKKCLAKYKYCIEKNVWQENNFDFEKGKFEGTSTMSIPIWRKHMLIQQGVI